MRILKCCNGGIFKVGFSNKGGINNVFNASLFCSLDDIQMMRCSVFKSLPVINRHQ